MKNPLRKKDTINLTRRNFLIGSVNASLMMAFTPGLVSTGLSAAESLEQKVFSPTVWFEINDRGEVLINIAKAEMGQHIGSALARIVADELECDWQKVSIHHVDTDPKWGYMVTGGSWSVFHSFKPLSQAGAAGRIALIEAGAAMLGVTPEQCQAKNGMVSAGNRSVSYGQIVKEGQFNRTFSADEIAVLPIKTASKRHLVGTTYQALDIPPKTNGSAVYGIDVEVPGMVFARPVLPPTRYGSKVIKVDDSAAKKLKGYQGYQVLTDPSDTCQGWVTVLADDYYTAIKAGDAIKVSYQAGETAWVSEEDIQKEGQRLCRDRNQGAFLVDDGDVSAAQAEAKNTIEALYTTATANHFQLEPLNAVAEYKEGKWHVHTGNQWQSLTLPTLAKAAQVTEDKVIMHQYYLGGGFGRRLYGDWIVPAILTSKAINKPVKLIFTRPDDTLFDQSRSASTSLLHASFNNNGEFTGLEHAFSAGWPTKSMAPGFMADGVHKKGKIDMFSASGADHWYSMENHRARAINNQLAQKTFLPGWLRAVGQGWVVWGLESFIDEIAHREGKDPVQFRLDMLDGQGKQAGNAPESVGGAKRLHNVLSRLRDKVKSVPIGTDEGIGFSISAGQERTMPAWIATAAHVQVNRKSGKITLKKLYAVADAGIIIHPDGAMAQMEGSLLWGTSLALHEHNRYQNGQLQSRNFHSYLPLRMNDLPDMDIELVDSDEFPVGLGEPGVIGVGPAIGNAVYQAVGIRLRDLPMLPEHVKQQLNA